MRTGDSDVRPTPVHESRSIIVTRNEHNRFHEMEDSPSFDAASAYLAISSQLSQWNATPSRIHRGSHIIDPDRDDTIPDENDSDANDDDGALTSTRNSEKKIEEEDFRFLLPPAREDETQYFGSNAGPDHDEELGHHDALLMYLENRRQTSNRLEVLSLDKENQLDRGRLIEYRDTCAKESIDKDTKDAELRFLSELIESCFEKEKEFWSLVFELRPLGVEYVLYDPDPTNDSPPPAVELETSPAQYLWEIHHPATPSRSDRINLFLRRKAILTWSQSRLLPSIRLPPKQRNEYHPRTLERTRSSNIVSLDPDSVSSNLTATDESHEIDFLTSLYGLVLRGQISVAKDLCHDAGQPHRAAVLSGLEPYRSPREGNADRHLHRKVCKEVALKLIRQRKHSGDLWEVESAVYSLLGNDIRALMKSSLGEGCKEKVVLMSYGMVRDMEDEYLFQHHQKRRKVAKLFPFEGMGCLTPPLFSSDTHANDAMFDEDDIWETLRKNEGIPTFLGALLSHSHRFRDVLQNYIYENEDDLLLLVTHAVIYISTIDPLFFTEEDVCKILLRYIQRLTNRPKLWPCVALYASLLGESHKIPCYTQFCALLEDTNDRKMALAQARKFFEEEEETNLLHNISHSIMDSQKPLLVKMKAVEWMSFHPEHSSLALSAANSVLSQIFIQDQVELGTLFLDSYFDSDLVLSNVMERQHDNEDVTLYQALLAYLQAQIDYQSWRTCLDSDFDMSPPDKRKDHLNETETKVAKWMDRHSSSAAFKNFILRVLQTASDAEEKLTRVLQFPGGWGCTSSSDGTHTNALRRKCLPQALALLQAVLTSMGDFMAEQKDKIAQFLSMEKGPLFSPVYWYKKSVNLAQIVAAEEFVLMDVLTVDVLKEFLGKVAESGVKCLRFCEGGEDFDMLTVDEDL